MVIIRATMDLKSYLSGLEPADRDRFAERCGTTIGHLRNVAYGCRTASEALAIAIDRESGGVVTCEESRPDVDWAYLRQRPAPGSEARNSSS